MKAEDETSINYTLSDLSDEERQQVLNEITTKGGVDILPETGQ